MAKDRRTRDQKRKAKLAKRSKEARKHQSHAYFGEKFKTEELAPFWYETETSIYEMYVLTKQQITDRDVHRALEEMVRRLRSGSLPEALASKPLSFEQGYESQLIISSIMLRWQFYFETKPKPSREKRIGILRSILGDVESHRSAGSQSQSYLNYIADFLKNKVGVSINLIESPDQPWPETANAELVQTGLDWIIEGDQDARADFFEFGDELLKAGEYQGVLESCRYLMAEIDNPSAESFIEIKELCAKAQQLTASG